jgi:hypothetical protein
MVFCGRQIRVSPVIQMPAHVRSTMSQHAEYWSSTLTGKRFPSGEFDRPTHRAW